ncbi:MAG: hypothetical protein AB1758_29880, partial [Candidatus Eremiobacterota bacterium]
LLGLGLRLGRYSSWLPGWRGWAALQVVALVVLVILAPNFVRHCPSPLGLCRSNLKNISTALSMYAEDNRGAYPRRLDSLVPNYLKTIPRCPDGTPDGYRMSYRAACGPDGVWRYTYFCPGRNHRFEQPNYPQYNSDTGLVERP